MMIASRLGAAAAAAAAATAATAVVAAPSVAPAAGATAAAATTLPPFHASTSGPLTPAAVPYTWRPGCPVAPGDLREIHLTFVGFDGRSHTGAIVVNAAVVTPVITVFRTLYDDRFPIMRMEPVDAFHGSDPASMAADNTSGFNCRLAVSTGPPSWSMHAYGEAIDVNTVQNPYFETGQPVQPPAGAAYADRADHRPGMAYPGGVLVDAFTSIGWGWGGDWTDPDYQHFSINGH